MEKKKFAVRLVAGAAAVCVTAALAAPSPAGAASVQGVGTSKASFELLSLDVGNLLNLDILTDLAQSTIDDAREPASAFSKLVPLSLTSEVVPALNNLLSLPTFESRSPGGNPAVSGSALDLASPATGLLGGLVGNLPLNLTGGSLIPSSLTSALDGAGARSALVSELLNLKLVSGLVGVKSVANKMTTNAGLPAADGTRALVLDAITVLNLGELLGGLGLPLTQLPLGIVNNLVGALQLPVALPGGAADLQSAVDGLVATIGGVLSQVGLDSSILTQVVNSVAPVNSLLGSLNLTSLPLSTTNIVPTNLLAGGTVQNLLTTLQGTLTNVLGTALNLLGNLPLLKLDGATVGATTKAGGSLADSAADVTAALGGLNVLGLQLPGLDLLAVGNLLNTVTTQLGNVLGIIDPSLRDLVKVGVLEKSTSVTESGGYINALAGIDVLSLKITPPALLSNLVGTLTGNTALSSLGRLSAAGVANPAASLPVLGGNLLGLGNLLNIPAALGVLSKGLSLKVGSIQSASQFRLASAPSPAAVAAPVGDTLPRTGGDTRTLGMLAAGMAVLALGVRRWARRTEDELVG